MGTLQKLVEVLEQRGALAQRLQESEVQAGLRQLESVLKLGLDVEGGGVYQWSKQQLEFGLAILDAVLCASCDLIAGGWEFGLRPSGCWCIGRGVNRGWRVLGSVGKQEFLGGGRFSCALCWSVGNS